MLKFLKGNAKLDTNIYTFSLPAGASCPFAVECKATADKAWGTIQDGKHQKYRCYAASDEARYPSTRAARHWNFDLLKHENENEMFRRIKVSLPKKAKIIRIHVSGDFFNQSYFNAWIRVVQKNPNILFYAYTKSLKYWVTYANSNFWMPDNIKLTASWDTSNQHIISENNLKFAKVVYTTAQAVKENLEIDHDDTHAYKGDKSFALLLHGVQPEGSVAAKARNKLVTDGVKHSYARPTK